MGFLDRIMTAINAGITAFREESLVPIEALGWDAYQARIYRYTTGERYYSNIAYKNLVAYAAYAARRKTDNKLYKRIRGVYNPVNRLIEAYVAKTYGGAIDFEAFEGGAIPITGADDRLLAAIARTMLWSNWRQNKSLYVRQGAKLGDVFIKIVDEVDTQQVRMELLHPSKVKACEFDAVGNIQRALIEYQAYEDDDDDKPYTPNSHPENTVSKPYTYTEIITPARFDTYKNGSPFAFYNDANGTPVTGWDNPYGYVPMVRTMHRDEGLAWGANAYQSSLDKIDELNDQASLLGDAVRKNVDVPWLMIGLSEPEDKIAVADDNRDDLKALWVSGNKNEVGAQALSPNLDIAGTLKHIEALQEEIERDMPELALHRMRTSKNDTSGVANRILFNDAIDRFKEAAGNYDDGLIHALQMAVGIGGFRKYKGFEGFSLNSHDRGDLNFQIEERSIIDDELSKKDKVTFLMTSRAPNHAVWEELGVSEDKIDEWVAEQKAAQEAMMTSFDIDGNPVGNVGDLGKPSNANVDGPMPRQGANTPVNSTTGIGNVPV